jgi:hypothetical protein
MPADPQLMAQLASEDAKPATAVAPAPAPVVTTPPAESKGCLGFLFGGKKK